MIKHIVFLLLFFSVIYFTPEMDVNFSLGMGMFFCFYPLLFTDIKNQYPLIQLVSIYNFFAYISPMIFHMEGYRFTKDVLYLREILPICQLLILIGYYYIISKNKKKTRFSPINFVDSLDFNQSKLNKIINLILIVNIFDLFPVEPTLYQISRPFSFVLPSLLVYVFVTNKMKAVPLYSKIGLITFVVIKTISLALGGLLLPLFMYLFMGFYVLILFRKYIILFIISFILLTFSFKLNGVKSEFRDNTWFANKEVTISEKINIIGDLVSAKNIEEIGEKKKINENIELLRIAHGYFYLCTVINQLDYTNDYYDGNTYLSIFTKIIPRAIWPDKPVEDFGQSIGRTFNLLDKDDFHTSVNLPILVEFYINFGKYGLVIMSLFLGMLIGYITLKIGKISKEDFLDTSIKFSLLANVYYMESNFTMRFGLLIPQILIYLFVTKKIWSKG